MIAAVAVEASGCQTLPAVVDDIANISKIVIADVEKGMPAEAIIADVVAQTGTQDMALVIAIVDSLLASHKLPAGDVNGLHAVHDLAAMKLAAQTGAKP
jgi:hypothetical protein